MQFNRNGVTIQVDDNALMDMVLRNVLDGRFPLPPLPPFTVLPHAFPPSFQPSFKPSFSAPIHPYPPIILPPSPPIGAELSVSGGVYAGNMRGRNGAPDYRLIVGPQFDGKLQWQAAMDWAGSIQVGLHKDFTLPFRAEQALLFANVPDLFTRASYWSCEPQHGKAGYARIQNFHNGFQAISRRADSLWHARAVRRLIIQ